jgi:hypothetical protein
MNEQQLKDKTAAIIREPGGELLDKLLRIGDLVGVSRPPKHVSPIVMGPE